MAIAVVQSQNARQASASSVTTAGLTTTAGNMMVADIGWSNSVNFTSVTDSQSNTYGAAVAVFNSTNLEGGQYYDPSIVGGAGHTVTLTVSGSAVCAITVREVSGHDPAPLDQTATDTDTTGTSHVTASTATTAQANELLLGGGFFVSGTGSVTSPWTQDQVQTNQICGSQVVSATGTYAFTFATSVNSETIHYISTWKEAAVASAIQSAGAATVIAGGAALSAQPVSAAGQATTVVLGSSIAEAPVSSAGAATVNIEGAYSAAGQSAISSAGAATVNIEGASVVAGVVSASGVADVRVVGVPTASGTDYLTWGKRRTKVDRLKEDDELALKFIQENAHRIHEMLH